MISAEQETQLRNAAVSASKNAYCPYSEFQVGAAVLTSDGRIFSGCNVENRSYGLTICAERNAVFQAVAAGCREIVAVAVYTPTQEPTTPCGSCRQVIHEFGRESHVLLFAETEIVRRYQMAELLPDAF